LSVRPSGAIGTVGSMDEERWSYEKREVRTRYSCPACDTELTVGVVPGYDRNEWAAFCPNFDCETWEVAEGFAREVLRSAD
jgi:hypothetical protein